jgi:hypothetical protein
MVNRIVFTRQKTRSAGKKVCKTIFTNRFYDSTGFLCCKNIFTYNEARPSSNRMELTDEPPQK